MPAAPSYTDQIEAALRQANPRHSAEPAPAPQPTGAFVLGAHRFTLVGGELLSRIVDPQFTVFEQLYRRYPNEAVYAATPERNARFTLGTFQVPTAMAFVMTDYRFDIYRQNGATPGDYVPIEERRLSTQVGYDVSVNAFRRDNINYQLDPSAITAANKARAPGAPFGGSIDNGATFNGLQPAPSGWPMSSPPRGSNAAQRARARQRAVTGPSGVGTATLPQRTEHVGARNLPYTMIVKETDVVSFDVVVWRPIPIPLAFFEVTCAGLLMPAQDLSSYLLGARPGAFS